MEIPSSASSAEGKQVGHDESGRTICLHSLAVLPEFQGKGLARTLVESYVQRMESQSVGDRIALLAHGHLVKFYEGLGFVNKGESEATFGGGGWVDMVRELNQGGGRLGVGMG